LTGEDAQQRRPLRLGGALVDHHRCFALALVYRAWPAEDSHELQAVELGRAVVTLLDLESPDRLAMSVRGQSVELAGAAVGAIAVDELTPLDRPLGIRHGRLLADAPRSCTAPLPNKMLASAHRLQKPGEAACRGAAEGSCRRRGLHFCRAGLLAPVGRNGISAIGDQALPVGRGVRDKDSNTKLSKLYGVAPAQHSPSFTAPPT